MDDADEDTGIGAGACTPRGMPWWCPHCECGACNDICPECSKARCREACKPHVHGVDD